MQEIFYEEASLVQKKEEENRKYITLNILSWIFFLLVPVVFVIVLTSYNFANYPLLGVVLVVVPMAGFMVLGIVFGKKRNTHCVDYDYTFISGSIRVAQVIKHVKRKFIMEFEAREIEKIGKVGSSTYNSYLKIPVEVNVLTSNKEPSKEKSLYYFVVNTEGKKYLLTFELTEKFVATIIKFLNKSSLLDDEYIKEIRNTK